MKRLLLLLCSIGVVFTCSQTSAQTAMPVTVVRTIRAAIAEEINLTADLQAKRISRLSSEVEGLIENLPVDYGDVVTKGQVVLRLNTELALITRARAKAETDEALARHREAQRRLGELTALAERQHVAATSVAAAQAEIVIAAAELAQARADERRAQALLDRHTVRAPFDGVINSKLVEVGQWVDTSDPLVELVETMSLRLEAAVPQFYFGRVQPGATVIIRFDALPEQIIKATVTTKILVSDSAARTFPIHIDVSNEQGLLAPGMSARVILRIEDQSKRTALLVPQDAIVRRPDGTQTVWTITIEDGVSKAIPREVQTGRVYHDNVEILSGEVAAGTQVVVRGNEILRPGQTVTVAEEMPLDI